MSLLLLMETTIKNILLIGLVLAAMLIAPAAGCGSSTPPPTASPVPASFFFLIQPAGAVAGAPFNTQPLVEILDTYGEIDNGFTGAVTLAITQGTGAAGAVLSGILTVIANDGVATFTNISIDLGGSGYSLTASGSGLATTKSASFSVTAATATKA
jgi:hypothetical protein